MKNTILENENLLNALVKKIASVMEDIDPRSIEKQLKTFDEDTICEIDTRITVNALDSEKVSIDSLRSFLEDTFERPGVHISDFYKQLSEKFNGKYSPEELELICECEKQLVCSSLKDNDIVETKSCLYNKRYKDCKPIAVSVSPHVDIVNVIKQLSADSKLQKSRS